MTLVGSLLVWVYVFQIIHCRQCLTSIFIRLGDRLIPILCEVALYHPQAL